MDIDKLRLSYGTDTALEQSGAPLEFADGVTLYVAAWMNPAHRKIVTEMLERPEIRRKAERKSMTAAEDREHEIEAMAAAVLVGWSGIEETAGGPPLPVTRANAARLLQITDIHDAVRSFALDRANYRLQAVDAGAEALKKSSSGS